MFLYCVLPKATKQYRRENNHWRNKRISRNELSTRWINVLFYMWNKGPTKSFVFPYHVSGHLQISDIKCFYVQWINWQFPTERFRRKLIHKIKLNMVFVVQVLFAYNEGSDEVIFIYRNILPRKILKGFSLKLVWTVCWVKYGWLWDNITWNSNRTCAVTHTNSQQSTKCIGRIRIKNVYIMTEWSSYVINNRASHSGSRVFKSRNVPTIIL